MDWFLIVISCIMGILLTIASIYILAIYCHPQDKGIGQSIYCKMLVVLGLGFSWSQILLLPVDIANSRGNGGGIDMQTCWYIIYIGILVLFGLLLPQAIFYYESDDEKTVLMRFFESLLYLFAFSGFISIVLFVSYHFLHYAELPIQLGVKNINDCLKDSTQYVDKYEFKSESQKNKTIKIEFSVDFYVYLMGIMAFVGYFFFVIFGGIGLSLLPLDLIQQFHHRPQKKTTAEARRIKEDLLKRTQQLIKLGQTLQANEKEASYDNSGWWSKRKTKAQLKHDTIIYNTAVSQLDEEYQIFKLEINIVASNPIFYILKLIMGLLGIVISILWWLHILLCMVITPDGFPLTTFLNKILLFLEEWNANFIATGLMAGFSLYLLWCVTKGNFKVGVRIPFLMTIHPMAPNETWMNSFLFNIGLIMLCSVSVTHFVSTAFSQYSRYSEMDQIFRLQVQYLKFFKYFFANKVFEISILTISSLSIIYVIFTVFRKTPQQLEIEKRKKNLHKTDKKVNIELQELLIQKDPKVKAKHERKKEKAKRDKKDKKKK